MNSILVVTLVRQIIVRSIYLSPFILGYLYIESPFNIIVACLLVIKSKLPNDTDLFELQTLGNYSASILARAGSDTDRENMELMKKTFGLEDKPIHQNDMDGSTSKFLVDTFFGIVESVTILIMIVWYTIRITRGV